MLRHLLLGSAIVVLLFFAATGSQLPSQSLNDANENKGISRSGNYRDTRVKGIQSISDKAGIVYTRSKAFRTDDGGRTWTDLPIELGLFETIAAVNFTSEEQGFCLLTSEGTWQVILAQTEDAGRSWTRIRVEILPPDLREIDRETASIEVADRRIEISFRLPTSSNFIGRVEYVSHDLGTTWNVARRSIDKRLTDEPEKMNSGTWSVATGGLCHGFKTDCEQETRVYAAENDITPPQIREAGRIADAAANITSKNRLNFAFAPGGSTRISLNQGFDKCTAASVAQMQTWWNVSPFYNVNIYISGRNRGCVQPLLTAQWVDQVSSMGWGLIPTIVGYQSPCIDSTRSVAKHSIDAAVAESQGRGEADIAAADAAGVGLTTGSILYYDMERYDEAAANLSGCRTATTAFLKGWTDRIKELGYKSGTYGSPKNAQEDWQFIPAASRMEVIWMARWDNVASVWTYGLFPNFPTAIWNDHQRIKQWRGPHDETWGGVTFNIDSNVLDAPVVGPAIAKNKNADFDGDGKTDLSIFRPGTGEWFISGSFGPTFSAFPFGVGTDILAPGDFDGDGKTDPGVWRPSDGMWYYRTKGEFTGRVFGVNGDIPVAADYNGDGKTDIALFRSSNGFWYIANSDSRQTFTYINFGQNGERPV
ncbi:MAG: DUF1906 domain-containing protein, partial [Acidobacteria bacterium]|nr:DUF1906 domain-containing protein [Acidobacteriota bacterium]